MGPPAGADTRDGGLGLVPDRRLIAFAEEAQPILVVVVDTEEEFDWSAGFDRANTAVSAMREVHRFQAVCDEFGVRPVYVADYPVATQEDGIAPLKAFHADGRAEIGAHLQPWVSPPYDEAVNAYNSYPGNLEPAVEAAKLAALTAAIVDNLGVTPKVYKAGRYGFGPATARALAANGYEVDLSPAPPMDFRDDGGPDYSRFPVHPYWFGDGLLGVPSTGAFVGFLRYGAAAAYRLAASAPLRPLHLPGVLARLRAVERLRLSPEGYRFEDNRRLTRALLARGVRVFTFSLHSPSLKPGCTAFVTSEAERTRFLDDCRRYFDWFLGEVGGATMTAAELRRHLARTAPP